MKNKIKILYISPLLCFSTLLLTACTSAAPVAGDGQSPSDDSDAATGRCYGDLIIRAGKEAERLIDEKEKRDREEGEKAKRAREKEKQAVKQADMEEYKKSKADTIRGDLEEARDKVKDARSYINAASCLSETADGWVRCYADNHSDPVITKETKDNVSKISRHLEDMHAKLGDPVITKETKDNVSKISRHLEDMHAKLDEADKYEKKACSASTSCDPDEFVKHIDLSQEAIDCAKGAIDSFEQARTYYHNIREARAKYIGMI